MKTKRVIQMLFKGREITIPKGQPVRKCPDHSDEYFVENFGSFINQGQNYGLYHDAKYYGIRIKGEDVE